MLLAAADKNSCGIFRLSTRLGPVVDLVWLLLGINSFLLAFYPALANADMRNV
jgi:hypothetical protein